ncbi:membrane-associated protein [Desulfovibrionales bacterium]
MLTEAFSNFATWYLNATGYLGAIILMAMESMIFPIPSETVMPFVGFQVADGKWNLWTAAVTTTVGSLLGSWLSYLMGYYGGRSFVLKVGKYFFLNLHHLEITEKFFNRGVGIWTIFIGRFVPVVRHLISIPAGVGKMSMFPFLIATGIGATTWNSFLLYLGILLGEHRNVICVYSRTIDIIIVLFFLVVVWWWYFSHRKRVRT